MTNPVPGNLVLAANNVPGPVTTGFEAGNLAVALDGVKSWVSLNNPATLNFAGQVSLEAWVKPAATQGDIARIISHGPLTLSSYDASQVETNGSVLASPETFLRLEGKGAKYSVGSSDGTNFDEVAIYNHALTPAQVQAHYAAATSTTRPSIAISLTGGQVTLTWTAGTLQESEQVAGQYKDVPSATSPYKVTPNTAERFYRVKQ
jgi:hypothetical protein